MVSQIKNQLRLHILDRLLLIVGSIGLLFDGLAIGVFTGDTPEIIWFRMVVITLSGFLLVADFVFPWVSKNLYPLVCGILFAFILLVVYLNYTYHFGFDYLLMLHVGVIISSIYFRKMWLLLLYLGFTYALVAGAIFSIKEPSISAGLLLPRMVLTMACGFGLNMLNRDAISQLRNSNRRFRMLAENSTDLIAMHDAEGTIEYANPATRRMLGYTENEVRGKNAFSFIHPKDRRAARLAYYNHVYLHGERVQLEYRLVRKDGSSIWVETVGTPLGTDDIPPRRIITTTRDATGRKQSEDASRRYQEKLLRINDELDQFSYIVSHDLKAPLRGISNLSNFIEDDLEELARAESESDMKDVRGELGKHLDLMRGRVAQMEQFIEDILAFSRAGRVSVEWEDLDLRELLEGVVENLALPASFKVHLPESIPPLMGTAVHFRQIFSNLISNAWKHHHREDGHIRVEYEDAGDFHAFSVTDDGPGIPAQFHNLVFEVFQQLQPREQRGGTGVGLAIVRKIVGNAGGSIELESREGEGTTFRILWPKTQPDTAES